MRGKDRKPRANGNVISPWTAERVTALTERWRKGLSANYIAETLGTTRNAVIGKAFRLGLKHPHPRDRHKQLKAPSWPRPVSLRPAQDPTQPSPAPVPISTKGERHD